MSAPRTTSSTSSGICAPRGSPSSFSPPSPRRCYRSPTASSCSSAARWCGSFPTNRSARTACWKRREETGMTSGESVTVAADRKRHRGIAAMLRSQMRNIAPFLTLICLFGFFAAASPSFATLDNLGNILTQISVTGIIAVGLTFVILCAEIDLSIAAIANVTGIAVAYFTLQDSYVNIANVPMPGWAAILMALALCTLLGLVNAFGLTVIGIPSFIMTLAMMQIAAGISALLVRGQIAYKVPPLITTLGSASIGGTSLFGGRGGIGNTIVGLFVLGVLNNGLDHVNIDSFLKILIRGLILLAALVINVYAQKLRERTAE